MFTEPVPLGISPLLLPRLPLGGPCCMLPMRGSRQVRPTFLPVGSSSHESSASRRRESFGDRQSVASRHCGLSTERDVLTKRDPDRQRCSVGRRNVRHGSAERVCVGQWSKKHEAVERAQGGGASARGAAERAAAPLGGGNCQLGAPAVLPPWTRSRRSGETDKVVGPTRK